MIKKKTGILVSIIMIFSMILSPGLATAKPNENVFLPETEGVYSVPGRSDLKLKVVVYHAKDSSDAKKVKPTPGVEPVLNCELEDIDSTEIVSAGGWVLPENWTYRVNLESVPSTITTAEAEELIYNSFYSWEEIIGEDVTFSRGEDTIKKLAKMDGQNIVTWGRTSSTALAVTYIWYNPTTGVAVEIDTIMNSKVTWYWSDPNSWEDGLVCAYEGVYDAQNILTHEIGHTVGLDDEYEASLYENNTMYGYGSTGETYKDTLTTGDITGAKLIYGLSI